MVNSESESFSFTEADENVICESEDCHKTANHILKWLNPEANPCEDFYEFACGNWKNLPMDQREQMSFGSRDSLVERFIPVLLKDPSTTNGNKHFDKLRNFMITCMDQDTIQSLGVTPIKQLIQKAGGWPLLDSDWSEEDWDIINAEIALGGVLIDVGMTYYLPENSSVATFLIDLGPSTLITRNSLKNDYVIDMIVDVAVALGANKEEAEKAMNEVLDFETAFVEALQNADNAEVNVITFDELQQEINWRDINKLLEVYLPESFKIPPEENVIFKKTFFIVLETFLNQYQPEIFVNYLISKASYTFVDYVYLHEKYTEETRFHYCTEIIKDGSLGPAMAAYLGIMYTNAIKVASEITESIKEELTKEMEETDWLDEVTRKEAAKNTSEIKIYVGFPPKITDLDELDKIYEGYDIDTSTFFDAMMYDKRWIQRREFDRLHKNFTRGEDFDNMGWRFYTEKGFYPSGRFIQPENAIEVSGPMLYFIPLFSPENPAYVNYGQVGTIVAHELIHAVDVNAEPNGGYFLAMEKWKNNQTENIYTYKKQCFIDFYSSINDTKVSQLKLNGNYTQREDIADNGGLKLSLRAYRKLANQQGYNERKLPRLQQYTTEQLFMISVANTFCQVPSKELRIVEITYSRHSPFEFRVNGMMKNSPDFSEIFNCDKKDPMNPPVKCEVWYM